MAKMINDEEIEISEDMEHVGVQALDSFHGLSDQDLVKAIYRAMVHQMVLEHPELEAAFRQAKPNEPSPW